MKSPTRKGLCLDDTTFHWCPQLFPYKFPNTEAEVPAIRLFRGWEDDWDASLREVAWDAMVNLTRANGIKVYMGAQISPTCNEEEEDKDWARVLELMKRIGRENLLAIAIGNEVELLWTKEAAKSGAGAACIRKLWGSSGYYMRKMKERVADLDRNGFSDLPLANAWGTYILSGSPFVNDEKARVTDFIREMTQTYRERYIFSINAYPYFNQNVHMDPNGKTCHNALRTQTSFVAGVGDLPTTIKTMRQRMAQLDPATHYKLFIAETGWSSPAPSFFAIGGFEMSKCADFSSYETAMTYYRNFVNWDVVADMPPQVYPPDYVFYFAPRNALNFGDQEYLGLIKDCWKNPDETWDLKPLLRCKFDDASPGSPTPSPTPSPAPSSKSTCEKIGCGEHDDTCWCTDSCASHGSCCPDYEEKCGGPTPSPAPSSKSSCEEIGCGEHDDTCWCTESCTRFHSCCPDYEEKCGRLVSKEVV